jgi:uncharacterized protein YgiB involved in biofilm formation
MKRSSQITLVLLTGAAGISLAGCDPQQAPPPPDNGGTFTSLAECVAKYDQKTCQAAQQLAQQEHLNNAPHFSSVDACRQQYGPDMCQPASAYGGHDSFFVPMMIGYMMGSAGSQPAPLYYAPYSYRHYGQSGYAAPLYSSAPSYRGAGPIGTAPLYRPSVRAGLNSSTSLTPAQTVRGGFGSSFKPTPTFKSSYAAHNPDSFGRGAYTKSGGAISASSYSSMKSSFSSSRSSSISSGTSRGGFGSSGRSFGGGGFGG